MEKSGEEAIFGSLATNMEQSFTAKKFLSRIGFEVLGNGLFAVIFLTFFLIALFASENDLTLTVTFGFIALWSIYSLLKRANWHLLYITRIQLVNNELKIEYLKKDTPQKPVILEINSTNIEFFGRGWGGAQLFFRLTNGEFSLEQISSDEWTHKAFVNLLTSLKEAKGAKLTHDEQDWINRLTK